MTTLTHHRRQKNRRNVAATSCGSTITPYDLGFNDRIDAEDGVELIPCGTCFPPEPEAPKMPIILAIPHADGARLDPQEYLGPRFGSYREAITAAGAVYVSALRTSVISIDRLAALNDTLEQRGFALAIDDGLRGSLETAAAEASERADEGADRLAEAEDRLRDGDSLYPYQCDGVRWLAPRYGALLADEMGLGKSVETLMALPANARVLVVAPKAVAANWLTECFRWRRDLRPSTIHNRANWRWPAAGEVLCVTYGSLPAEDQELTPPPAGMIVVADEAHMLRGTVGRKLADGTYKGGTRRVRRWNVVRDAAHSAGGRVWLLTGTPLLNRPTELWRVIEAAMLGLAKETFGSWPRFIEMVRNAENESKGKGTASTDLTLALQKVMLRRDRATVLPDLPRKRRQIEKTEIADKETMAACDELVATLAAAGHGPEALAALGDLPKDVRGVVFAMLSKVRAALAAAKTPRALEIAAEYEANEIPVVAFSAHLAPLKALASLPGWALIDGSVSAEDRQDVVLRFQAGELKGIAASFAAGGVGITLTHAHHVLCVDLPWTPALLQQAEDRCVLEGQPILTVHGWRPVEAIRAGDNVIGGDGLSHKVIDAWSRNARGVSSAECKDIAEIHVRGWYDPIKVTTDHRMLTARGWVEAADLRPRDQLLMPSSYDGEQRDEIDVCGEARLSQTFVAGDHETFGDHYNRSRWKPATKQTNGRLIVMPSAIALDDDALFVTGYYVGDGHAYGGKDKGRYVSFAGNASQKTAHLKRCRDWVDGLGVNASLHAKKYDNGVELRAYSGELARWFIAEFGAKLDEKRIPEWIFGLSRHQRRTFLSGWMAADGHERTLRGGTQRHELTTAKDVLAAAAARLLMSLGEKPCVRNPDPNVWRVDWSDGQAQELVVTKIVMRTCGRVERVYDLTVEGAETFVVGTTVAHNCCRIGQDADSVHVRILAADHDVDARVAEILVEKTRLIEATVEAAAVETVAPDDHLAERANGLAELAVSTSALAEKANAAREAKERDSAVIKAGREDRRQGVFAVGAVPDNGTKRGPHTAIEVHAAASLIKLADLDPDRAGINNNEGFNGGDSEFGHSLASQLVDWGRLSPKQWVCAVKMVRKYHRQVGEPEEE